MMNNVANNLQRNDKNIHYAFLTKTVISCLPIHIFSISQPSPNKNVRRPPRQRPRRRSAPEAPSDAGDQTPGGAGEP